MSALTIISIVLLGWFFYSNLRQNKIQHIIRFAWQTYTGNGFLPYVYAIIGLPLTLFVSYFLYSHAPSFMQYGWFSLVSDSTKSGTVISQPFTQLMDSKQSIHGVIRIFGMFVVFVLIIIAPQAATSEEEFFRRYETGLLRIVVKSVIFGLLHMIMGVSLSIALALATCGGFYALVYNLHTKFRQIDVDGLQALIDNGTVDIKSISSVLDDEK